MEVPVSEPLGKPHESNLRARYFGQGHTCQGAVQYEAVKIPQLHCLVG